jgi:hypothetical protein
MLVTAVFARSILSLTAEYNKFLFDVRSVHKADRAWREAILTV